MTPDSLGSAGVIVTALMGGGGLWALLRTVVRGRIAVRLDRENSSATLAVLQALPPGGQIFEKGAGGGLRIVRTPGRRIEPSHVGQAARGSAMNASCDMPSPPGEPPGREAWHRYGPEIDDLFRAEAQKVRGFLIKMGATPSIADDIVQDSFMATAIQWEHVRSYEKPIAYVYKVAGRMLGSQKYSDKRVASLADSSERSDAEPDFTEEVARALAITDAIMSLPSAQRKCILLHYNCSFTVAQIAGILQVAEGTVKSNLSDGRARLATLLKAYTEQGGEEYHEPR